MSEADAVIELCGVTFGYGRERVLDEISLPIYPRDYLVILGPNGGGKSTLLKVLLGIVEPWTGEVISHLPSGRRRLGYVPQFSTFETGFPLYLEEVVLMGRLGRRGLGRRWRRADREAAREALAAVKLDPLAGSLASELSGGQVQRLLLARALAGEPEALILDEPMASLDPESRQVVSALLAEIQGRMPVVLVTHDASAVAASVRHIACLNRRLTYHGASAVTPGIIEETYGCPVELIAHGVPHRVLAEHGAGDEGSGDG